MKKVVLLSLETANIEWSPAKYQLLEELSIRGVETYVFLKGVLKNRGRYSSINHIVNTQNMSKKEIRKKIKDIEPQAVIATLYIDTNVIYMLPYFMKNTNFFYYNLEIFTPYLNKEEKKEHFYDYMEYKLKYPVYKIREVLYTRKIKAFSIQDKLRMKVSEKYFIHHPNTVFVPNTYIFDQEKVVPYNQSGVVYTGGIKRDFLLKQFKNLSNVRKASLTFSGYIDSWCKRQIKVLKNTNSNIRFTEQVLPIDEYTNYLQQFAVGLVWYSPLPEDEARYYMGLSSGKMFKHLSLGQPIIASRCRGITEIVNRYKLGIIIDDISELDSAYEKIMKNYSYYRNNVLSTYQKKYDFRKVIVPFLDNII